MTKTFKLPAVITTSAADGPNGPVLPVITNLLADAPIVHRPGNINAWDNEEFVAAVKKTGRKKLILAGVSTEVCVAFVALSAVQEGYDVYAVIDASGTWNKLVQEVAIARMVQAGVKPITWVAVGAELLNDWRNPQAQEHAQTMGEHLAFYGNLIASCSTKVAFTAFCMVLAEFFQARIAKTCVTYEIRAVKVTHPISP